ncbi:MAG: hypothetical protein U0Z53_27410 [Blastocatellia bacterium]
MRTLFEDVNEKSDREDDGTTKSLPVVTWLIAAVMIAVAVGTFFWVRHRQQVATEQQAVVPVSLEDENQLKQVVSKFGSYIVDGNWAEAEKMLSADGRKRLETEKKTLRESLLGERIVKKKDEKVVQMFPVTIAGQTPSTARADCAFIFADRDQTIIPITLVKEDNRLVINSW